jgi:hypothetical protein
MAVAVLFWALWLTLYFAQLPLSVHKRGIFTCLKGAKYTMHPESYRRREVPKGMPKT